MSAVFLAGLFVGFVLALIAVSVGIIYQAVYKVVRLRLKEANRVE